MKRKMLPRNTTRRRAFSMIELLVVIAILGILLATLAVAIQKARAFATNAECQNHLRNLGQACQVFKMNHRCYPRSTVRPRGVTRVNCEPPGNLNQWTNGSYESWLRQIASNLEQSSARTQDPLLVLGCPADPRGPTYSIPTYGFTWYVGVFSNRNHFNDGIIVDDSALNSPFMVTENHIADGISNTILIAERPPAGDGKLGWWDSPWTGDDIAPVSGTRQPVSSSSYGNCPQIAAYRYCDYADNCCFNSVWSNHDIGGNVCYADTSVRILTYAAANQSLGSITLMEALATRADGEAITGDF